MHATLPQNLGCPKGDALQLLQFDVYAQQFIYTKTKQ